MEDLMRAFLITAALVSVSVTQVHAKSLAEYLPNFLRSAEGIFLGNCEKVFKERLRSPSTYQRKSYTFSQRVASPIEAAGLDFENEKSEKNALLKFKDDIEGYRKSLAYKMTQQEADIKVTIYEINLVQHNQCQEGDCPNRAKAFVRYEAANAFGTPVAGQFVCETNFYDSLKSASSSGYRVNGLTEMDYIFDGLKN